MPARKIKPSGPVKPHEVSEICRLYKEGFSLSAIARSSQRSRQTVRAVLEKWTDYRREDQLRGAEAGQLATANVRPTPSGSQPVWVHPIADEHLEELARVCLSDFERFMIEVIAPTLPNFDQVQLANFQKDLLNHLNRGEHSHLLVHIQPGAGKSVFLLSYIIWCLIRDRNLKVLYMTVSEKKAMDNLDWIKGQLEHNEKLIQLFGRFKPDQTDRDTTWSRGQISIAGATVISKAKSVSVYGTGQRILGTRVDLIVGDDVIDSRNVNASFDDQDRFHDWWHDEVESRLEPGGTMVVVGQRLGPSDLYAYLYGILGDDGEHLYYRISYPAHDPEKCAGDEMHTHRQGWDASQAEWPTGCTLFPSRMPYRSEDPKVLTLRKREISLQSRFEVLYNQKDVAGDEVLVTPVMLNGGVEKGRTYPGCWDDRHLGFGDTSSLPHEVSASVISIDPSPTRFWAVQHWLIGPPQGETPWPTWHLVDLYRERMDANQLLDFGPNGHATGLLVEMCNRAERAGFTVTHVILEVNAAQRWIMSSYNATQWFRSRGIKVLPHNTSANKTATELGVWGLQARFEAGTMRLPKGRFNNESAVDYLVNEITAYPFGSTDDQVMACWFPLWNEHLLTKKKQGNVQWLDYAVPKYERRGRKLIAVDSKPNLRDDLRVRRAT